jgi:hypothetical protein
MEAIGTFGHIKISKTSQYEFQPESRLKSHRKSFHKSQYAKSTAHKAGTLVRNNPRPKHSVFFQVLLTFRDSHPLPYTFPNSPQSGQIFLVFFNCYTHRALQNMLSSVVFGPSSSSSGFVSHPYEPIHQEKSRLVRGSGL